VETTHRPYTQPSFESSTSTPVQGLVAAKRDNSNMAYTLYAADVAPPSMASYFFPPCTGGAEAYVIRSASDPHPEGSTVLCTCDTAEGLVVSIEKLLEEREVQWQEDEVTFCFTDHTPTGDDWKKSSAFPDMLLRRIAYYEEEMHEMPHEKMKTLDVHMELMKTMPTRDLDQNMMRLTLDIKGPSSDFHLLVDHVETDSAECSALYHKLKVYADSKDSTEEESSGYSISWEDHFPYVQMCHVPSLS
jgi:hypothetical protein